MNLNRSTLIVRLVLIVALGITPASVVGDRSNEQQTPWVFVSMSDFLNVDTDYLQPGWEDTLNYILESAKAENPDFLLVAGDLVMGHWWSEEDIEKYAARYYPAWMNRLAAHGLEFYAAIGDHDIGDNPWRPDKAKLVPLFKRKFRDYLGMPRNGPEHMKGTAFWWRHKGVLFVAVDVFEEAEGPQGAITAQVTGKQLIWLDSVLAANKDADHLIVMGHTPILGPVRRWSSSGLMLREGHDSPLWEVMKKHGVDLYLCGEVHAITCIRRDGVEQIAHGGLIGYNTRTNYLVAKVYHDRIELELKEIDMVPSGKHLWQPGNNRPLEKVTIPERIKRRGFTPVGRLVIDKSASTKRFRNALGYFKRENEPKRSVGYYPIFSERGPREPPRITIP